MWPDLLEVLLKRAKAKGNSDVAHRLVAASEEIGSALIVSDLNDPITSEGGRDALRGGRGENDRYPLRSLSSRGVGGLAPVFNFSVRPPQARDLAQRLVGVGAEIWNALHLAVENGHEDIVSDLPESVTSIDAQDTDGCTPLHVAAEYGKTEMAAVVAQGG